VVIKGGGGTETEVATEDLEILVELVFGLLLVFKQIPNKCNGVCIPL